MCVGGGGGIRGAELSVCIARHWGHLFKGDRVITGAIFSRETGSSLGPSFQGRQGHHWGHLFKGDRVITGAIFSRETGGQVPPK